MGFNIDREIGGWADVRVIGSTENANGTQRLTPTQVINSPARVELTLNLVISVANGVVSTHIAGMTPAATVATGTEAQRQPPRLRIAQPAISIAEALRKWREHMTVGGTGPEQQDMVCKTVGDCATFCHWHTVGDVDPDAARKWLVSLRPQYKPRTLKHFRDRLKQFGAFLRSQHIVHRNPFRGLPQVKVIHEAARLVPTDAQVSRLIQYVASTPVRGDRWLVYLLAATSGIRIGAIRQLHRSMFRHDATTGIAYIDLPARVQKNRKAARVYLPRETALLLDNHPQQTPARWFKKVPKPDDFDRDIERAGLPKFEQIGGPTLSIHSLRHFASNRMKWAETMSDAERAQQNTHLSPAMTTRVYTDASHPDYGKKIYRMQGLLPDGFTPTKPKRTRKSERNLIDSTGDSADTKPAEFVSPQKPTPFNAAACGTPSELSTHLIAGAALSGVSVGGRASITTPQQQVQGSTPSTRVAEKKHLLVQGDLKTVALVIEALASRQGGWGLVTIRLTIEHHGEEEPRPDSGRVNA